MAITNSAFTRRALLGVAGLCGLAGIVLEHGMDAGDSFAGGGRVLSLAAVVLFLLEFVLAARAATRRVAFLRERWPHVVLVVLLLVEALIVLAGKGPARAVFLGERFSAVDLTRAYLIIAQVYILGRIGVELPHLHRRFASTRVRPAVSFIVVFAALVLLGTALLMLPRATPRGQPLALLDALFTSTSAVCVTGLVVRDTGAGFTVFGQAVILALIQLGGLGIMSLTAALSLLLGRGIGVRESSFLREVFNVPMVNAVGRTIRFIIIMTLVLEAAGTVLIHRGLAGVVPGDGARLFTAVFHAVSAFCNAGFSTLDGSLVGVADNPLVTGTAAVLFVVGGLGFGVVANLGAWLQGRLLRTPAGRRARLGLQEKVVVAVSLGLLIVGAGGILALESGGALAPLPVIDRLGQALFQSATCRTAGFNSIDLNSLAPATHFLMIMLMFVGGAPGSTAGGIKVTTLAVAWANMRATAAGRRQVRLGGRELEQVAVQRAMLVLSSGVVAVAIGVFVLLLTEGRDLLTTVFEVVSAMATVGLTLGLTPLLSPAGRVVVILLMFIGRLGPLTLAASLSGAARDTRVRLPRGRILIG